MVGTLSVVGVGAALATTAASREAPSATASAVPATPAGLAPVRESAPAAVETAPPAEDALSAPVPPAPPAAPSLPVSPATPAPPVAQTAPTCPPGEVTLRLAGVTTTPVDGNEDPRGPAFTALYVSATIEIVNTSGSDVVFRSPLDVNVQPFADEPLSTWSPYARLSAAAPAVGAGQSVLVEVRNVAAVSRGEFEKITWRDVGTARNVYEVPPRPAACGPTIVAATPIPADVPPPSPGR